MSLPPDLPDNATELARLIVADEFTRNQNEQAWQKLNPVIEAIAARKISWCREVQDEALSCIWMRVDPHSDHSGARYDPAKCRKFEKWCEIVLINRARDICGPKGLWPRQFPEGSVDESTFAESIAAPVDSDWLPIHRERRAALRGALDKLHNRWPREKHHYYFVFLFQISWRIGLMLHKDVESPEPLVNRVQFCLPWTIEEKTARWALGWPSWEEILKTACVVLERAKDTPSNQQLCAALNPVLPNTIESGTWNQRIKRAKNTAMTATPKDWTRHFAVFFPDHCRKKKG